MKLPDLITLIAPTQICNQILGKSFERVECCYFSPVKAPSVENESCSPRILFHPSVLPTLVHPLLHSNFKILPSRNHNPLASYISLFSSRKEYISRLTRSRRVNSSLISGTLLRFSKRVSPLE